MFDGIYLGSDHQAILPSDGASAGFPSAQVRLHGALDGDGVTMLRDMIVTLGEFAERDVTLDISSVRFLDGAGIGLIAGLYRRLRQRGLRLTIAGASGQPAALLRDLGLGRLLGGSRRAKWFH